MNYLSDSDITDKLVLPFKDKDASFWAAIMSRTNAQALDVAEQLGVFPDEIATPLHNSFKDLLRAYFCMQICKDATEVANLDQGIEDKYASKYKLHAYDYTRLKKEMTKEMITGNVHLRGHRASGGVLWNG